MPLPPTYFPPKLIASRTTIDKNLSRMFFITDLSKTADPFTSQGSALDLRQQFLSSSFPVATGVDHRAVPFSGVIVDFHENSVQLRKQPATKQNLRCIATAPPLAFFRARGPIAGKFGPHQKRTGPPTTQKNVPENETKDRRRGSIPKARLRQDTFLFSISFFSHPRLLPAFSTMFFWHPKVARNLALFF